MVKRELPVEKTLFSTCMQHDMPKSLLVVAVSFTPETINFGTFCGVAQYYGEFFIFYFCLLLKYVYAHF